MKKKKVTAAGSPDNTMEPGDPAPSPGFSAAPQARDANKGRAGGKGIVARQANRVGAIELVKSGQLCGWAWSGDPDAKAMTVVLMDGSKKLLEFCADQFRADVAAAGYGDGRCGFAIELPARLFDGEQHEFKLLCAAGNEPIPGASKAMRLTRQMARARTKPIEGRVERLGGITLEGWVYDPDSPNEPVGVEVIEGNEIICAGLADHYREDLVLAGKGDGYCGFRVRLPDACLDGRALKLRVRECATDSFLDGELQIAAATAPSIVARIKSVEGGVLRGEIETFGPWKNDGLQLWIDGSSAGEFGVPAIDQDRRSVLFEQSVPGLFMDGEEHEFVLTLTGTRVAVGTAKLAGATTILPPVSEVLASFPRKKELPAFVRSMADRVAASALFDRAYFSRMTGKQFASDEAAILHYLTDRAVWWHPTSSWLDVAFVVQEIAREGRQAAVSPLEWYLGQDIDRDVGPNPLFSNADYQIQAGLGSKARPLGASFFDDWLANAGKSSAIAPSFLVDLGHLGSPRGEGKEAGAGDGAEILHRLLAWLQTPPEKRQPGLLHPYFDEDWLAQCYLLKHNQPKGCQFTAFRLGQLDGQSPLPVLQQANDSRNYYELIRAYEILWRTTGVDDITSVCPEIDADLFYAQYPAQGAGDGRRGGSSLYRYVTASASQRHASFLKSLDDAFVAAEYPGLVEYCLEARGIGDINRIWSRWLRLLGVPGNYVDSMGGRGDMLTIEDLMRLKQHRHRTETGIGASFIIPSYGRDDLVLRCVLSAIQSSGAGSIEFLVAEDATHIDCAWVLKYFLPFARISRNPENLGFLLSCKNAVEQSSGEVLILVNNDVIVHRNAVNEMLQTFHDRPEAAVVGGLVLNLDGTIQENGGILWRDASAWNYHRGWKPDDEFAKNVREADYVSGCWIGIRRSVWDRLGGFDARYAPAYCEESDFCMQCWQTGYKVLVNPLSVVTHLDGATMGQDENSTTLKSYQKINRAKLLEKWKYSLAATHSANGNLTPFHTSRHNSKRFITIVFDHYLPEPDRDAGSRTIFSICETLAAMENNYVLFVPMNNHRSRYAAALERLGIEIIVGAEAWKHFDDLLQHHKDHVKHVFVSRLAVAKQFSWHLDQLQCPKSIYIHDIDTLRGFPYKPDSPGHEELVGEAISRYVTTNQAIFSRFDHILSCSEDETRVLKTHFGGKVVDIFPYNLRSVKVGEHDGHRSDLIFVGSYNHPPNREGIQYFTENVWPHVRAAIPNLRLHICGSGLENAAFLAGPDIILHGHVTDQTLAYLYSISRLAIAPLLTGAGVKGKVIEAGAHGVACVGTEVAWQGLALPKDYACLSGDIASFGERLLQAYRIDGKKMASDMVRLHDQFQSRNNIADVIPRLVNSKARK